MAILLLGPTGCGFHPLYGQRQSGSDAVSASMADIRIGQIIDRNGQILRNDLIDRLTPKGEPANPRYNLGVILEEHMVGLGQQTNSYATLGEMSMSASFIIRDSEANTGFSGHANSVVSVNFLGPRYGSVAVERDAEERGLSELADDIRDQIASYLNNPASRLPAKPAMLRPLDGVAPQGTR